jgi:ketosteroid isomerase-like protein
MHPLVRQVQEAFERDDPHVADKKAEQENVRHLQRMYGAFLRGDLPALLDDLTEDVDWQVHGPADVPFAGAARGREQVARLLTHAFGLLEEQRPAVRDVIAQGDQVTVVAHETGRCKHNGAAYAVEWVQVFTFRGGKVARFREYCDSHPLLTAMNAAPRAAAPN